MSTGEILRKLRRERRMTQAQVASLAGITQGTYSLYEADKATPGIKIIAKISAIFNVPASSIDPSLRDLPGFGDGANAVADAEMQELLAAWPSLSLEKRRALIAIIRTWRDGDAL